MAPAHEGALIQVFTLHLREESMGSDFLYVHFADDPLSFGFLICALTGGGFMAGWQLSQWPNAALRVEPPSGWTPTNRAPLCRRDRRTGCGPPEGQPE